MKKKILVACLCVALAMLTIAGTTLAYLTSKDEVTNSFTVGKVGITLNEAKVTELGEKVLENGTPVARVKQNDYKLMPGHEYTKDPTVHVTAGSEKCYVFVKVENGISAFESKADGYKSIATQITANGWKPLDNVAGVYYQEYTQSDKQVDYKVFENFQMDDNANTVKGWDNITADNTKVTVTAYAVQFDGFDNNLAGAWNAAKAAANTTTTTNP